ncbi:MAG TPA: hypothetical protein VGR78_19330 [Verrucomicrobiae bacterium]|nr:hypothetical protein [Verrucomicrobiae bacterium]
MPVPQEQGELRIESKLRSAHFASMRYVVKNKQTGYFLRSSGDWTPYLSQAERFPNGFSISLHLEGTDSAKRSEQVEIVRLPLG